VFATLAIVAGLGVVATGDLLDAWDLLPWMGERVWWREVAGGAVFAMVIPLVLSALWGRRWLVGFIAGLALAFLLHVTAAVLAVYGLYRVAEAVLSHAERTKPRVSEDVGSAPAVAPSA
jgi:hypothetical protein